MKNILIVIAASLLISPLSFSQTPTPVPKSETAFAVDYPKLESDFLNFLKKKEYFNPKQHFVIQPSFGENKYHASITMTESKADGIAGDDDALDTVGRTVTGLLVVALMNFAQEHGLPTDKTPYRYAMGFLFVTSQGVTGKATFAQVGYSSYDPYSDGVKYTSKLK